MRTFVFGEGGSLPAIVTIQMATRTVRFTTWDRSVTIDGNEFVTAAGADVTGFTAPSDATASNCDIALMAVEGGLFPQGEGIRGMLDGWPIEVSIFDPNDLSAGASAIVSGVIGSVDEDANGMMVIAANGPLRQAQARPLTEHYSLVCRADLGDDTCKVPICGNVDETFFDIGRGQNFVTTAEAAPGLQTVKDCYGRVRSGSPSTTQSYNNVFYECTTSGTTDASTAPSYPTTPGATVVDGTATMTCRDGWLRYAEGEATGAYTVVLESLPDARASDDTWYVDGGLFVRSGNLEGYKLTIRAWDSATKTLTLFLPIDPDDIPANTQFEIYPGCDRTRDMCFVRFNNIVNMRAETMVPPADFGTTTTIPQAQVDNLATDVNTLLGGITP